MVPPCSGRAYRGPSLGIEMLREEGDLVGDDALDEGRVVDLEVVRRIADRAPLWRLGRDPERDLRLHQVLPVADADQQRTADLPRLCRGVIEEHGQARA